MNFLFLVPIFLAACSSRPRAPEEAPTRNEYTRSFANDNSVAGAALKRSLPDFLGETLGAYLVSLDREVSHFDLFSHFAPVMVHGNFHPLQVGIRDGSIDLKNFESSDFGPWWLDVIRMESSAKIIADAQSLKSYQVGACLDAYTETIAEAAKLPASVGNPVLHKENFVVRGPEVWEAIWRAGSNPTHPEAIVAAYNAAFPKMPGHDLRGDGSGYVMKLEAPDAHYVSLRPESAQPLAKFGSSPQGGKMKACERYGLAEKFYVPAADPQCLTVADEAYSVHFVKAGELVPLATSFHTETNLVDHVAWMCTRLAKAHLPQWTSFDVKVLALVLRENHNFTARVKAFGLREAEKIEAAYRQGLKENIER